MSGIYIHIPFCKQACSYCDFYFSTRAPLIEPFVDALESEILHYKHSSYTEEAVQTLYFGGGTPSLLTQNQFERIIKTMAHVFELSIQEFTVELNPDDVTPEYLEMLRRLGVNRISMGIQSFDPELLNFMNRAHTSEEAVRALAAIQQAGFPTYTADLIYGNPGQTLAHLEKDVQRLLDFDPPHISAYSLTVEPKTRLGKQVERGRIRPPDDEEVAYHADLVRRLLGEAGIEQYEVSNYSVPGNEARHNSNYWNHENYLGFGPSAHSFWWDATGAKRWQNVRDLQTYINDAPSEETRVSNTEHLTLARLAEERMMLGLRTKWGVPFLELKNRYDYLLSATQKDWLSSQIENGMILPDIEAIKFTTEGMKIADLLIVDLLSRQ